MSALVEAFENGGLWMYVIVVWGAAFYGLLALQYRRRRRSDFTWVLWGLLASLALLGPLGSTVGVYQASLAMAARESLSATEAVRFLFTCLGIASTTTIFSTLLAAVGAVALGLVTHRVKHPRPPARPEAAPAGLHASPQMV